MKPGAKPVLVKIGGSAISGGALDDLSGILALGTPVALVHGGGRQLTRMLGALASELGIQRRNAGSYGGGERP